MVKKLTMVIVAFILFPVGADSSPLEPYEKGQLAGALGFGAMTIDAYYEICFAKGKRVDNHLKGIDKLLKNKWGFTSTEIAKEQEEWTGRNFRQEAHNLVNTVLKSTGGCNTDEMQQWYRKVQDIHEDNLSRFHAAE